jgi:hypothetical protein
VTPLGTGKPAGAPHAQAFRAPIVDERGPATANAAAAASGVDGAPALRASALQPGLWVRVLSGPSAGRELPLTGDAFVIGSVGQQVATLVRREGAWTLARVDGSEPLVLNGAPVSGDAAFVAPGDRFVVAGSEVELERR